ncbi:MAG: hypothetical protein N2578_06125 [Bdellovibrionaceae bacterium]|nr:hypothetical protein [Pseudobdellovibrionaceae bacterium]
MRFVLLSIFFVSKAFANTPQDGRVDIWPTIPFIRGADLCAYKDAFGQSRSEYMRSMVRLATEFMFGGARGREALSLLVQFNELYDRNVALATQYHYLDVTLESTLKAYLDNLYRDIQPRTRKVSFTQVSDLLTLVHVVKNGKRDGYLDEEQLQKLDYIAYGTYALAPDCRGSIQVTLHLVGKNGETRTYLAQGVPATVMSQIAARLFEDFQRTRFPSTLRVGNKTLELVGGLNGSVDRVMHPRLAEQACATLQARLPNRLELEIINSYGDWSGGVSFSGRVFAYPGGKVYHPRLQNPDPVREVWEVNAEEYLYYCVRDL